jgi:CheY-like chemotaxis protein
MATIMVVDDEPQMRRLMRRVLEAGGHEVLKASGGEEALDLLGRRPVDLVITDIVMPEMDGLELIRAIRGGAPAQKILAVSGGGQSGRMLYLDLAEKLGADGVVRKPFKARDFLRAAAELIGEI